MDKRLLEIIACPLCKGKLLYQQKNQRLICKIDKLAFAIKDDIPILLVDEAIALSEEEMQDGV